MKLSKGRLSFKINDFKIIALYPKIKCTVLIFFYELRIF